MILTTKDMMFFSTSNLISLRTHGSPNSKVMPYFPGAGAGAPKPWRLAPRKNREVEVQKIGRCFGQCFSQTSQGFVGPVWDIFGGEEGYGIQNMFGRIFLFLQMFVVEIETVLV